MLGPHKDCSVGAGRNANMSLKSTCGTLYHKCMERWTTGLVLIQASMILRCIRSYEKFKF